MSSQKNPIFSNAFTVTRDDLDQNGHVNNVVYVKWMQDVAVLHSDFVGGSEALRQAGGTWVVRSHTVHYLKPAFEGDRIEAATWIEEVRKVRCTRRYEFRRKSDGVLLAHGTTEWVYVERATGRPKAIPAAVIACFVTKGRGSDNSQAED